MNEDDSAKVPSYQSDAPSNQYMEKIAHETGFGRTNNPPVRKVIEAQIIELRKQIEEREQLLKALNSNPGVEDVMDKMRKLHL